MAYTVKISNRFRKQFRLCVKRGLDMNLINEAMRLLAANGSLPAKYRPHKLSGKFQGVWEWLMTWEQNDTELTLLFLQTGTHSDLF